MINYWMPKNNLDHKFKDINLKIEGYDNHASFTEEKLGDEETFTTTRSWWKISQIRKRIEVWTPVL